MPRRTRACATCRQKRIKCDATMPHCLMCQKFNRKCPGPTDAPLLFVDTSSYPSGKKPRAKKSSVQATSLEVAQRFDDGRGIAVGVGNLPEEMADVLSVHISPRHMWGERFFQNLVAFFCAEGRHSPGAPRRTPNWLYAVPRMAATPPQSFTRSPSVARRNEALDLALRATTAAFSSLEMRNDALLHHAYGLYGSSLRFQGRVLQEGGNKVGDLYMVMTSLILSLFESVVATTGEGFASHNIACAKMIDDALVQTTKNQERTRGNGANGPGPIVVNVFFHIRVQLCFVYLTTSDPRIRNDTAMKSVLLEACGWDKERLPLNMQIITPFARLLELQAQAGEALALPPTDLARKRAEYMKAKKEVDHMWHEYEQQSKGQQLCWTSPGTGHTDFRDPFTSLIYAYFSACYILIDLLAPTYAVFVIEPTVILPFMPSVPRSNSISPASSSSSHTIQSWTPTHPSTSDMFSSSATKNVFHDPSFPPPATTNHFALILSVSWYLRLRDTGFAYLRLHAPLFLVAMYAPSLKQRSVARMVFEDWKVGALRGIGWLAISKLDKSGRNIGRIELEEQPASHRHS
ncbi:hypothetical protein BU23DRAFT_280961 [Bimuria novae-zelandiae CBS 107.79]|uniref:Zn(2)-C6 fungal-type domain-containing protein n=1 Tax=Bimuria novae-zelandiae CBS 107.79 TaxID=1447943 RepID=A0A6A5UW23_9PLEO|nr:hypothetical protein BU23DRAFT_280961 [Bimuria novae-zelandiae CBS 107.79]